MYKAFFGLAEAPFNITPDSKFLFLSERHREALSALLYGIRERKGFILLTGDIGSGKTTLCRALVNELHSENVRIALILNPGLSEMELLKAINDEFQIPSYYNTKKGLIDELNRFLIAEHQRGGNVAMVIDEAQTLTPELLEQVRMLSNLETETDKLVQIVLIGQPELNGTMALPELEQLNQRVAVRYHITPLSLEEMEAYIRHRLFVARAKIDIEFTEAALKLAYEQTGGVPRRINVVCDRALLACYVAGSYTVDDKIMQKAVQEIAGPAHTDRRRSGNRPPLGDMVRGVFTSTTAMLAAAVLVILLLVLGGVALGVRLANLKAFGNEGSGEGGPTPAPGRTAKPAAAKPTPRPDDASTTLPESKPVQPAAPTPTPDYAELRRSKPNWMWEKTAPLVRVNNPKAVYRAAQLSMLKMWGIAVDLRDMAKLGEDYILHGELKSDKLRIHQCPMPGTYYEAVRLNVPLMVKIKEPAPNESEYVVLLRSAGEAVDVGDPVWGVKTYKTKEFVKRWAGATAVFIDVKGLCDIKRGDKNERVRDLQQFLKEKGYQEEVSGTFDVKTTEGIRKFQAYYKLRETGQLDELTAMVLNSRMMQDGPRLNAADDMG